MSTSYENLIRVGDPDIRAGNNSEQGSYILSSGQEKIIVRDYLQTGVDYEQYVVARIYPTLSIPLVQLPGIEEEIVTSLNLKNIPHQRTVGKNNAGNDFARYTFFPEGGDLDPTKILGLFPKDSLYEHYKFTFMFKGFCKGWNKLTAIHRDKYLQVCNLFMQQLSSKIHQDNELCAAAHEFAHLDRIRQLENREMLNHHLPEGKLYYGVLESEAYIAESFAQRLSSGLDPSKFNHSRLVARLSSLLPLIIIPHESQQTLASAMLVPNEVRSADEHDIGTLLLLLYSLGRLNSSFIKDQREIFNCPAYANYSSISLGSSESIMELLTGIEGLLKNPEASKNLLINYNNEILPSFYAAFEKQVHK